MRILPVILVISTLFLGACGAENDARDVCDCYKEVMKLKDNEADEKMTQCLQLLEEYRKKHKDAGTLEEFNKAYDLCR